MFESFRQPKKVVRSDLPVMPADPNRADEFVKQAKQLGANGITKPSTAFEGRVTHSTTPGMNQTEAAKFGKIDQRTLDYNLQNPPKDLLNEDPAMAAARERTVRAGYFDLDEQVEGVTGNTGSSNDSEYPPSHWDQLSPLEQREQYLTLGKEMRELESRRDATDDAVQWSELNRRVKQKQGEREVLGRLLARSGRKDQV